MPLTDEDRTSVKRLVRIAQLLCVLMIGVIFLYPLVVMTANVPAPLANASNYVIWSIALIGVGLLFIAPKAGAAVIKQAAGKKQDAATAMRLWFSSTIIAMVLREAAATVGLILSLMTENLNWCFGFGLLSMIAIGRNWPRNN